MNKPNRQEIRAKLEERRERARDEMRREEAAMDALSVEAVRSLTQGLQIMVEDPMPRREEPSVQTLAARRPDARRAIKARGSRPASPSPAARTAEPPLRAALRGIVEDYAEPITPSEQIVTDLEALSGIALDEADSYGLWADLELREVLAVRAAMRGVIEAVTDRAESIIIAELVAAEDRLAREYPDAPRPDSADANDGHDS